MINATLKHPPAMRKLVYFLVANGTERDHHHVKTVKPTPVLDKVKAHRPRRSEGQHRERADFEQSKALQVQGRHQFLKSRSREAGEGPLWPFPTSRSREAGEGPLWPFLTSRSRKAGEGSLWVT